jgi:hypothetical protein
MPDNRDIWFHEDDYCQQQLLPGQVEVVKFVQTELRKSSEFAEAHRAPGGIAWTDVYVIEDPPLKLRELKIDKEEVDVIVSGLLPRFDTYRVRQPQRTMQEGRRLGQDGSVRAARGLG